MNVRRDEKDTEITKKTVDEAAKKKALDIVEKAKQKGKITYAELANELDDTNPENIDKVFILHDLYSIELKNEIKNRVIKKIEDMKGKE